MRFQRSFWTWNSHRCRRGMFSLVIECHGNIGRIWWHDVESEKNKATFHFNPFRFKTRQESFKLMSCLPTSKQRANLLRTVATHSISQMKTLKNQPSSSSPTNTVCRRHENHPVQVRICQRPLWSVNLNNSPQCSKFPPPFSSIFFFVPRSSNSSFSLASCRSSLVIHLDVCYWGILSILLCNRYP